MADRWPFLGVRHWLQFSDPKTDEVFAKVELVPSTTDPTCGVLADSLDVPQGLKVQWVQHRTDALGRPVGGLADE